MRSQVVVSTALPKPPFWGADAGVGAARRPRRRRAGGVLGWVQRGSCYFPAGCDSFATEGAQDADDYVRVGTYELARQMPAF